MTETPESTVLVSVADHIADVRLNRPDKHNAIGGGMLHEIVATAAALRELDDVRVVVLRGEGPSFCAGLDTANLAAMGSGDLDRDSDGMDDNYTNLSADGANRAQQVGWSWQELDVPVIAAVHGAAFGGGLNLALGADLRVMAPDAKLGFVEITWGLMPDMSATQSLRRLVGLERAKQLVLTGRRFSGADAVAWGLATELADDPTERAFEIAREIAGLNPAAVRAAKAVLNATADADTAAGFLLEASRSRELIATPDQIEAVVARLEGRTPRFEG
jgi:enoyl-CoA hydratase/carnithine racemase